MSISLPRNASRVGLLVGMALASCALSGCQDGPLYALKAANPYFVMKEWREDEVIGVSDHTRRKEMSRLAETIHELPPERQDYWATQLDAMIENDPSPEMRRLAVRSARRLSVTSAMPIIEKGLDDSSMKVRMEACRSLGARDEEDAARMLASTVATETDQDVRHAAVAALQNHKSQIAVDSLRLALNDRNPATRTLAVESLRGSTGKDYGDDPDVWIAALEGKPTEESQPRFAERIRDLF